VRKSVVAVLLGFVIPLSGAVSIGIAPSSQNLGVVERGETATSDVFLLVNDLDQRFVVRPEYQSVSEGTYESELGENYSSESANRRNFAPWLSFPSSGQTVDPAESVDGSGDGFDASVPFQISVPEDAEPGWYVGKIDLNPQINQDVPDAGVGLRAVARPTFLFRVSGDVSREVEVVQTQGFRTGESQGTATATFRNTGSVTAFLSADDFQVVGPGNIGTNERIGGEFKLGPGESRTIRLDWEKEGEMPAGNYRVQGVYNHMTGAVFVDETVQIQDFLQNVEVTEPEGNQTGPLGETGSDNTWVIVLALMVLATIMYSFDIDPVWILTLVGVLGLTGLVILLSLPIWILALTVIVLVVVLYVL
jgi:hypothetical protein